MRLSEYNPDLLNRYTSRTVPGTVDVIGTAESDATVTVNEQRASRHGNSFRKEIAVDNASAAVYLDTKVVGVKTDSGNPDIVTTVNGNVFVPKTPEEYGYDGDGNLTSDGRWTYTWDAENRLVKMESLTDAPAESKRMLKFQYDYQSRRIQKLVSTNSSGSYVGSYTNRFVYDGWNLIAIINPHSSGVTTFQWGLDLSGSMQGAGGVGGLLCVSDSSTMNNQPSTHFVAYDGNGNLIGLFDASTASATAQYEYGPFGELVRRTGVMAEVNPFRFSTKYQDDETDLLYYGYRYYNPSTGRWLSRDPIGERRGGANLYGFVNNNCFSYFDSLGLQAVPVPIEYPPLVVVPPGDNIIEFPGVPRTRIPPGPACVVVAGTVVCGAACVVVYGVLTCPPPDAIYPPGPDRNPPPDKICKKVRCKPCNPGVGSIAYRVDRPPSPAHNGIATPHSHKYQMNQSPPEAGCRCFWKEIETDPLPGELTPEIAPASGGGIEAY